MSTVEIECPSEWASDPMVSEMWKNRHFLFSKFDEGIVIPDTLGWAEVTTEACAAATAKRIVEAGNKVAVDGFGGCGGNTIQLALVCDKVYCVELSPSRLEAARNNARVYGVEHKIEFILGDFLKVAPTIKADAVFMSPPWSLNFEEYLKDFENFDLKKMRPLDGVSVYNAARSISKNIAYMMPPTIPHHQFRELADPGDEIELVNLPYPFRPGCVCGIAAFYGNLAKKY